MTETIDNAKVQTHKTADNIQEIQVTKCVDCRGENCPIPLLETRRAVIKGQKGDVIRVIGDHESSKLEIPMALESLKCAIIDVKDDGKEWSITFRI